MIREEFIKLFSLHGILPNKWAVLKMKQIVLTKISDGPHETPELFDEGIPFISAEAIKNDKIDFDLKRGFISEDMHREYSKKCKPQRNDIFIIKSGATTGNVACVDVDLEFNIWSPLAVVRCDKNIAEYKFIYYQLLSDIFKKQVELSWSFGTQENIGMGVIERLNVIIPKVPEQKKISNYLDKQCTAIDKVIITKKEQLIILEGLRKSIIHKAVTKGLDDSVEFVDSGIDWIGKKPKHWKISKLKYYVQPVTGYAFNSDDYIDGDEGIPLIRIGDILEKGKIDINTAKKLPEEFLSQYKSYQINDGDILIAMTGATIGKAGRYNEIKPSLLNQRVCMFRPSLFNQDYLWYILKSPQYEEYIKLVGFGAAQPNISDKKMVDFYSAIPPNNEQLDIVKYLNRETERISSLTQNIYSQIITLEKYRKSLIHECVTGKRRITEDDLKELANV